MADLKALAETLVNLTVKDVKELADILKNEYGIEPAAAAVAVAAPGAGGGAPVEEVEVQTEFTVTLKEAGPNKLNVVKVVKTVTGLGLKEAKDVVDTNGVVKEKVSKEEAEAIKAQLVEAGATARRATRYRLPTASGFSTARLQRTA
jgi:large subunit ribosomal protein L7/L12